MHSITRNTLPQCARAGAGSSRGGAGIDTPTMNRGSGGFTANRGGGFVVAHRGG